MLNFKAVLCCYGVSLSYDIIRREIIYRVGDKDISDMLGTKERFDELVTYLNCQ